MTMMNNNKQQRRPLQFDNNDNLRHKGLGWVPDIPDARDFKFKIRRPEQIEDLPPLVNLREHQAMQFPIFDQGDLGSCTANAISAAMAYVIIKQNTVQFSEQPQLKNAVNTFIPSRLFIYFNERVMENSVNSDAGAMIRDGIKSVNQIGACRESDWPYTISQFTTEPPLAAYSEAEHHQALLYQRLDNSDITQLKYCLFQGFPFVMGFAVFSSFMTKDVALTGNMPMPNIDTEQLLGGHAVLACGYSDIKQAFIVRNSWSDAWGDGGYFYMPYDYVTNTDYCDDFWNITLMEKDDEQLQKNTQDIEE